MAESSLLQVGVDSNGITNCKAISAVKQEPGKIRCIKPNEEQAWAFTDKEKSDELDTGLQSFGKSGVIRAGCRNSLVYPFLYAGGEEVARTLGGAIRHRFSGDSRYCRLGNAGGAGFECDIDGRGVWDFPNRVDRVKHYMGL